MSVQPPPSPPMQYVVLVKNTAATLGLVFGIIGVFIPAFALAALPCGIVGATRSQEVGVGRGAAIAGVILGALVIVAWLIVGFVSLVSYSESPQFN